MADGARSPSTEPEAPQRDATFDGASRLVCVACGGEVTADEERIQVSGAHEHTFMNPAGHVFLVGTFARARVLESGTPSFEWTWFPGFAWTIAGCARCGAHLGWSFRRTDETFYGLVLDRVRRVP